MRFPRPPLAPLLLLGACASTPPAPRAELSSNDPSSLVEYAQLQPGSARTYAVRFPGQEGEITVTVLGREDGWLVDDRGGKFRFTNEGLRDPERYLVRTPLEAGTSWTSILSASAVERYRIVSVGEPCEVRAGSFSDCLVVESTIRRDDRMQLTARWTWIRGVGLGRVETTARVDGRSVPQTRQDLVHYDLDGSGDRSEGGAPPDSGAEAEGEPGWGR